MSKEINLWVLVDSSERIYYTGFSPKSVQDYMENNFFKDKFIVKLTGTLPQGEKNV